MTARFDDSIEFNLLSCNGIANSAMGNAATVGNWGWSISNATTLVHSLSATSSTAADIANALATLITDLGHRGVIRVTGGLG